VNSASKGGRVTYGAATFFLNGVGGRVGLVAEWNVLDGFYWREDGGEEEERQCCHVGCCRCRYIMLLLYQNM